MFSAESWQEFWAYLKKNKLRTFLTSTGVSFGIYILLTLLGVGQGFNNKMRSTIADAATNSVVFWCEKTTLPYKGFPANRFYNFKEADIKVLRSRIPEIECISPETQAWGGGSDFNTVYKKLKGSFTIRGATADYFIVNPITLDDGRTLNPHDSETNAKIAIIGDRVKEVLFPNGEDPVGAVITVNDTPVLVVGSFTPASNSFGNAHNAILLPYTTFQKMYNRGDKIWSMIVSGKSGSDISEIEKKVKQVLMRQHNIHPNDAQAIGSVNVADIFNKISAFFKTITFFLWMIGIGTLLTGVIGVSNIMLVVVKERTKEFGIKRALGATPYKIAKQVIFESVTLTFISGFFGFLFGVLTVEGINSIVKNAGPTSEIPLLDPYVDFVVGMSALAILVIFGCIAGYLPAKKAISIKPIDALRSE